MPIRRPSRPGARSRPPRRPSRSPTCSRDLSTKTSTADVKITYTAAFGPSSTLAQDGKGKSSFVSQGNLLLSDGTTVIQCNGTTAAAKCTDLGPTSSNDALTQVITTYAGLSSLHSTNLGTDVDADHRGPIGVVRHVQGVRLRHRRRRLAPRCEQAHRGRDRDRLRRRRLRLRAEDRVDRPRPDGERDPRHAGRPVEPERLRAAVDAGDDPRPRERRPPPRPASPRKPVSGIPRRIPRYGFSSRPPRGRGHGVGRADRRRCDPPAAEDPHHLSRPALAESRPRRASPRSTARAASRTRSPRIS